MEQGSDPPVAAAPMSLRAWAELRAATVDPGACDPSDAALVAAAILADVRELRIDAGPTITRTVAGTAARRLANALNSVERLALAAQRLGVEALTARLRYDLADMETRCADMYWHLSEAAGMMSKLDEYRAEADRDRRDLRPGRDRAAVVQTDDDGVVIDLRDAPGSTGRGDGEAPPAGISGVIVAAAMGFERPDPIAAGPQAGAEPETEEAPVEGVPAVEVPVVDGMPAVGDRAAELARAVDEVPAEAVSEVEDPTERPPWPAVEPPDLPGWTWASDVHSSPRPRRRGRFGADRRQRRAAVRAERTYIRDDERRRGSRPMVPTWLAQGLATVVVCALLALVVLGLWLLLGSDAGPF